MLKSVVLNLKGEYWAILFHLGILVWLMCALAIMTLVVGVYFFVLGKPVVSRLTDPAKLPFLSGFCLLQSRRLSVNPFCVQCQLKITE